MRTVRVIPCLDVDAGRVVKGVNFVGLRDAGDPVELAARYDHEGADELVFLDITASVDSRDTTIEMVRRAAEEVFIPFTVGGGIRSVADARGILRAGADKVSVNTAAVDDSGLVTRLATEFGSQCVVVAVDARRSAGVESGFEVFTRGGRTPTGLDAVAWVAEVVAHGAGSQPSWTLRMLTKLTLPSFVLTIFLKAALTFSFAALSATLIRILDSMKFRHGPQHVPTRLDHAHYAQVQ